jgi:hypothetical protein
MRHDEDRRVLEVGARTRTIPPALRRALQHRDRGCRFPGCGVRFGQGRHHLRHWAQGGPTTLSNLALLCRRHHRAVHEEGYQVGRGPDGELRFHRPDGRPLPEVPPSAAVPDDPVNILRAWHASQGLRVTARTACPRWLGEPLDVGWAIDVLHPRAARPASLRFPSPCPLPRGERGVRSRGRLLTNSSTTSTPWPSVSLRTASWKGPLRASTTASAPRLLARSSRATLTSTAMTQPPA